MKTSVTCDLCGSDIVAAITTATTTFHKTDASGKLKEPVPAADLLNDESQSISYQCSNPDCRQIIGDIEYLKLYAGNPDPDEFRLFKQLDILQDVLMELCRMQLHTDSLNASVVIRNTLKDLPEKLPIIIEMKRKMVEGDFIDTIDINELLNRI